MLLVDVYRLECTSIDGCMNIRIDMCMGMCTCAQVDNLRIPANLTQTTKPPYIWRCPPSMLASFNSSDAPTRNCKDCECLKAPTTLSGCKRMTLEFDKATRESGRYSFVTEDGAALDPGAHQLWVGTETGYQPRISRGLARVQH